MTLRTFIDALFGGKSPFFIVITTSATIVVAQAVFRIVAPGFLWRRFNSAKWTAIRAIAAPIVRKRVEDAAHQAFNFPAYPGEIILDKLPSKGLPHEQVVELARTIKEKLDQPYDAGGFSGAVYHGGKEHTEMVNRVMEMYQWTNPLHVDIFGAARKMEAEVAAMVLHMYNGQVRPDACAAVTSGGTESIGLAMKSYREWGRHVKGIHHASIVAPITAHPAFDKACNYYGLELIKVPIGPDGAVEPDTMRQYIKSNTVAIVGSSPNFPHGTIDPIPELAELAYGLGIGLHVDACLGGFIVPFMEKAGFPVPVVDLRNRGVTTISADTHKYGFAPKGTSVVVYGSKLLRSFQFFSVSEWPGGIYCSPGASGSKPGNVIAGTWAAMVAMGEEGYIESCKKILLARQFMTDAIRATPYLRLLGTPLASVFGFTSDTIDVYELSDELKKRGWYLSSLQFPAGLQFSVTLMQTAPGVAHRFVKDLLDIGDRMWAEQQAKMQRGERVKVGSAGSTVYGSQQRISDRALLNEVMKVFLDGYYDTGHSLRKAGS
jgi:sphinganine-1-phosphate aldolase